MTIKLRLLPALFVGLLALGPISGSAAELVVDAAKSTISLKAASPDVTVTGQFQSFNAQISFDPASATGKVAIRVPISSLRLDTPENTARAKQEPWFNMAAFPEATYSATSFEALGEGQYLASGTLTLRGASAPLALPFTLMITGDAAKMTATVGITRQNFELGTGSPLEHNSVAPVVEVTIALTATQQ